MATAKMSEGGGGLPPPAPSAGANSARGSRPGSAVGTPRSGAGTPRPQTAGSAGARSGAQSARGSGSQPRSNVGGASTRPPTGAQTARSGSQAGSMAASEPAGNPNNIETKVRVYPNYPPDAPRRPMSATNVARVARVKEKQRLLDQQFLGRPNIGFPRTHVFKGLKPERATSLPAWWSKEIHGEAGKDVPMPRHTTKPPAIKAIKKSLMDLRLTLSKLPWADGRPVQDPERRIRGELADMEVWMRDHLNTMAAQVCARSQAPAVYGKDLLLRAFRRADITRTGDVTVQEFADVWNNPETGLRLMVPVLMKDAESGNMVNVQVKADMKVVEALDLWQTGANYPQWGPGEKFDQALDLSRHGRTLLRPKKVLEAHAAALFIRYGYDRDGLMPYEVFANALFTTPGRLLGMEPIMNQKARGIHGFSETDDPQFDGKIIYQKAKKGVFPPSDFDPIVVTRSSKAPAASMKLEHAHGYAGLQNLAPNLFYTDNPSEVVYYVAGLGVVLNTDTHTQKHFFGHNNTIRSLAIHPSKFIVATGQNKATGPTEVPYVCIWETRSCKQLQRLNHPFNTRAIAACGFSSCGRKLVTVGTDNPHSLFIWNWQTDQNKLRFLSGEIMDPIPGWPLSPAPGQYGPDKKLSDLENSPSGFFFKQAFKVLPPGHMPVSSGKPEGGGPELGGAPDGYTRPEPDNGMSAPPEPGGEEEPEEGPDAWKKGVDFALDPPEVFSAMNGAPPQVNGVVWNPFKADEFVTYGVKHIKWWRPNPETGQWEGIPGSFGSKVDNVLSAVFIRDSMAPYREIIKDKETGKLFNKGNAKVTRTGKVIHYTRDPDNPDKVIKETYKEDVDLEKVTSTIVLTGFPTGEIGIWIDGLLMRCIEAHHKGPQVIMPDGSCTFTGVRCLKLRADRKTVLSGGADGCVYAWDVRQTVDDQPQYFKNIGDEIEIDGDDQDLSGATKQQSKERKDSGTALRGAKKGSTSHSSNVLGRGAVKIKRLPGKWKLTSPYKEDPPPAIRSVDAQPGSLSFVVGTNKCDVWELRPPQEDGSPGRPKCLTNGHTADVYACATHPKKPNVFASAAESSNVRLWDSRKRELMRATSVGFQCRSVQFSQDGQHLAVGGKLGRLKILKADTMQPLVTFKKCNSAIDEIKYAPNNRLLATGSHDLYIDIYDTGFRGPGGDKKKAGKVLKYPEMNTVWEKEKGGKGEYIHMSRCSGHSATINHLDFSLPLFNPPELRGRTLIVSNCNSYEILYWDALTGQQILANQRDTKWHTRTTMLGFDVMGIWPDGSMNVSVNALDRSHNLEYAATGDDYSLVKIFNYPVVHDDAPWRECKGHSSHVTSVRWSSDDRTLISVGGGDRSAFQFRTTGVNKCDGGHEAFKSRRKETPWCDVAECMFCGREPLPPPPPPLWGPLDDAGRTWGAIDYNPRTGKCSCANCEMRMRQEFRVFDPDATGRVTKIEFKLVLTNFGEQQVTMESVDKAMSEHGLSVAEGEGDDAVVPYESICAKWDAAIKERWAKHEADMEAARAAGGGAGDDE